VGAIAVHAANGTWGVIALGLSANGTYGKDLNGVAGGVRGLFYGDSGQFFAQLVGAGTNVLFVGAMSALCLTIIGKVVGNRVRADDEIEGLDLPEMGIEGYSPEYRGVVKSQIAGE
jgi:Amt family ammonium transporter